MDATILKELILLQFQNCIKQPHTFVKMFNPAKNLAALDYDLNSKQLNHVSHSLKNMLGLKKIPELTDDFFYCNKIHPGDRDIYLSLFNDKKYKSIGNGEIPGKLSIFRCRVKHAKGYWKYLLIISFVYLHQEDNHLHKMAIVADEAVQHYYRNSEDLMFYIAHDSSNNLEFEYQPDITSDRSLKEISISRRELEVLKLLAKGLIAKQIALKLSISTNTVISHKKNLISKFNVKNSVELVKCASQLLLV